MTTPATFPDNAGFTKNIRPGFVGDLLTRDHLLPGGAKVDAPTFNSADAVAVTVATPGAGQNDAGDTAVKVAALPKPIPAGAVLDFGGAKFARLTAEAAEGATVLAVGALPTALADGDTAYYDAPGAKKRIPAGSVVGLTNAELEGASASGVKWGKADDSDDVVRIIAFDIPDADKSDDCDLLRAGTLIKVNFLPGWDDLSSAVKGKIRAAYEVTVGAPGDEVPAS